MASRRLNKNDRDAIVYAGVRYTFGDQKSALKEAGDKLVLAVRARMYPENILKMIDTLPDVFTGLRSSVRVYIKSSDDRGGTDTIEVVGTETIRFAAGHTRYSDPTIALYRDEKADAELIEAVREYEAVSQALTNNEKKFTSMAKALVGRYTTAAKLIEAWPDAKLFIPKSVFAEPVKEYLPAETMQTLEGMVSLAKARRAATEVQAEA